MGAMLLLASVPAAHAAPIGLGAALNFGLLVDAGNLDMGDHGIVRGSVGVLGGDSTLRVQCYVTQDLADGHSGAAVVNLGESTHVVGKCATDVGGAINLATGATCGTQDTTGAAVQIANLNQAIPDEESFETVVAGLPATQTIPAINLGFSKTKKVFDAIHGGLNVIHVPSVTLADFATLYISGGVEDRVVFVIDGPLSIGKHAKIVLIGGLLQQNTFIEAPSLALFDDFSSLQGTLHIENTCTLGEEVTINGALYCDGNTSMEKFFRLNFVPCELVLP
jgi:hypothetical protein